MVLRYFFDVHDGVLRHDAEGVECADLEAARVQARKALADIVQASMPDDGDNKTFTIMVRDESGVVKYAASLTFREQSV
ncbi:DUF6894 family protein [Methylorubrum populi]